jgi:hypothetical protein
MNESQRRKRLSEIATEELGGTMLGSGATELEQPGTLDEAGRVAMLVQIGTALSGKTYIDQIQALCSALTLVISMPAVSSDSACQGADDFAADLKARIMQRWPFMEQLRAQQAVMARMRQEAEAAVTEGMTKQ